MEKYTLLSKGPGKNDNINRLIQTYKKYSTENWDGYGALPVKSEAVEEAKLFIENLPSTVEMPTEIDSEPNGGITMEWRTVKNEVFMLIFNGSGKIVYAGIREDKECKGTEYFNGSVIPEIIIENIRLLDLVSATPG